MAQHLRVDLSSLTAMRHTVISLRCIPQNFSPGLAPQVGQQTASTCFGLSSFFMAQR
jgi:hypothetical protein